MVTSGTQIPIINLVDYRVSIPKIDKKKTLENLGYGILNHDK